MTVLLHGLGREGLSAARYLTGPTAEAEVRGREVVVVEERGDVALPPGCRRVGTTEAAGLLGPSLLYLRSPGVPPSHPLVAGARAHGATVTTPTGYYLSRLAPPGTITVTGTKGKSTTTALLAAVLRAGGRPAAPYGNIGRPPLGPALPAEAHPVVELSSYMTDDLLPPAEERGWWTAHLLTNLHKEHTDWHGSEAAYRAAKLRPYRMTPPCPGLAPAAVIAAEGLPGVVGPLETLRIEGGTLVLDGRRLDLTARFEACRSPGTLLAARAAAAAALPILGPERTAVALASALDGWAGLPSRQAVAPSGDGRLWVDDALATVPEATTQALTRFGDRPVRLVLGGKDRGQDLEALVGATNRLADGRAYGFGEVSGQLARLGVPVFAGMEDAVRAARDDCPAGGVVLFSPAAPSGAPHAGYEERAAIFAALAAEA